MPETSTHPSVAARLEAIGFHGAPSLVENHKNADLEAEIQKLRQAFAEQYVKNEAQEYALQREACYEAPLRELHAREENGCPLSDVDRILRVYIDLGRCSDAEALCDRLPEQEITDDCVEYARLLKGDSFFTVMTAAVCAWSKKPPNGYLSGAPMHRSY